MFIDRLKNGEFCQLLSLSILLFISNIYIFSFIGFFLFVPINSYYLFLALGSLYMIPILLKKSLKIYSMIFIVIVLVLVLAIFLSNFFYDISWDGQTYHQGFLLLLSKGFNPIYNKIDYLRSPYWPYPIYFETVGACFLSFFKNIEIGKCVNILLAISVLCYFMYIFGVHFKMNLIFRFILSFIVSFSPVVICQIFTYYVDGLLGNALTYLFLIFIDIWYNRFTKDNLFRFFSVLVIAINLKFTGLVYVTILLVGFCFLIYIKVNKFYFKKFLARVVMLYCIAVVIFGFYPYVLNSIYYSYPFYPLNKVDIITNQTPWGDNKFFLQSSRFKKFVLSILAKPQNVLCDGPVDFNLNRDFSWDTYEIFFAPDVRINGFGTLFPIILFFLILLCLFNITFLAKKYYTVFIIFIVLVSTIFINPACWWARFIPHLYSAIFLVAILLFLFNKNKYNLCLIIIMILVGIINIAGCAYYNIKTAYALSIQRKNFFNLLNKDKTYYVQFNNFIGNKNLLILNNIKFQKRDAPVFDMTKAHYMIPGSQAILFEKSQIDKMNIVELLNKFRPQIKNEAEKWEKGQVNLTCVRRGETCFELNLARFKSKVFKIKKYNVINCPEFCSSEQIENYLYTPYIDKKKLCIAKQQIRPKEFEIVTGQSCWLSIGDEDS